MKPSESEKLNEWPIKWVALADMHDRSITRDKVPMISIAAVNKLKQELEAARAELKRANDVAYSRKLEWHKERDENVQLKECVRDLSEALSHGSSIILADKLVKHHEVIEKARQG